MSENGVMSEEDRRRQARRMRIANVPMRAVLGLPFPTVLGKQLMLVHHVGRKTGRHYRQPVSYVRQDDVLLTPGGGRWKLNLREGEPASVRLRGKLVRLRPELVGEPDEVQRLLAYMFRQSPRLAAFVPFVGKDGTIDRPALENAVRYGFRIVRWHPVGAAG
jgi:deazaflavin-dependent oxidoreductase (nitroreductase family)